MTIEEIDKLKPHKAVLYLRVSSKKQTETAIDIDKDGNSIATQRDICQQKAQSLNADIVHEFVEPGVSAQTIEKRPVFKDMMKFLGEHRDVDFVIVYARSRAFRNFVDAAITRRHLDKLGVRLLSAREDFGEGTYAEAMEAVTDIMNQVQNQLSGEDIRIKMRNKAINGGTVSKARLGYLNIRKDIEGRMINSIGLDEKRAPLVLKAFELYSTGKYSIDRLEATMDDLGLTTRRTARTPEQPVSASKLHAMLKDPYYVGYVSYKGELYPGRHEPIVGQDLFDLVQEVMSARSGSGSRDRVHDHYLKGMLYCLRCHAAGRQSRMIYMRTKGHAGSIHEYYFCRLRQEGLCDLPHIPTYVIEDKIIEAYDWLQLAPEFEADVRERLTRTLDGEQQDFRILTAALSNRLREVDAKETRLIDLASDGALPAIKIRQKLYELRVQKDRIQDELANLESKIAVGADLLSKALDQISNPKASYIAAPDRVRRLLNETFYNYFWVGERGVVRPSLNHPFDDILAAQHAFRSPVVSSTTKTQESISRPPERAKTGVSATLERQFVGNKKGADFSTPSLLFNLASIYSNHGSNKATLVGLTGFEPATPWRVFEPSGRLRKSRVFPGQTGNRATPPCGFYRVIPGRSRVF
ncbi:recombinase family protein [Sinomonas susongensis]|uniref:recombinase family protein n=1 Tax=Sinomonas susongensis TaxID=1324851 RepID=UPI001109B628|nr:recombinase family protein [Sinomonas susongensis]